MGTKNIIYIYIYILYILILYMMTNILLPVFSMTSQDRSKKSAPFEDRLSHLIHGWPDWSPVGFTGDGCV